MRDYEAICQHNNFRYLKFMMLNKSQKRRPVSSHSTSWRVCWSLHLGENAGCQDLLRCPNRKPKNCISNVADTAV
ncbi:hypothetical protein GJAV_G00136800 [Gymnothorax javanicus]|nr:hypothetical protein GJAV_G00136800 [Gymnothorax javanicus]